MTDPREIIAQAIEAEATRQEAEARYWGLPDSRQLDDRARTLRVAARIARETRFSDGPGGPRQWVAGNEAILTGCTDSVWLKIKADGHWLVGDNPGDQFLGMWVTEGELNRLPTGGQ